MACDDLVRRLCGDDGIASDVSVDCARKLPNAGRAGDSFADMSLPIRLLSASGEHRRLRFKGVSRGVKRDRTVADSWNLSC